MLQAFLVQIERLIVLVAVGGYDAKVEVDLRHDFIAYLVCCSVQFLNQPQALFKSFLCGGKIAIFQVTVAQLIAYVDE